MSEKIDKDPNHSKLIRRIAYEHGLSYSFVKRVVTHQHKVTVKEIKSGLLRNIKWPKLGKFRVNWKAVKNHSRKTYNGPNRSNRYS